jgi:hypothetical protein
LETFIALCFYVLFHDDARPFSDLSLINWHFCVLLVLLK